jgi:hypothetical protein
VRIRSLDTQAKEAQRSVDIATKNYRLSREGYRRGLTDYVNVLIAQTQQLRAQEGVARVRADQLNAHATLVAALGGGLVEPADGPSEAETWPASERRKAAKRAGTANAASDAAGVAPAARDTANAAQPVATHSAAARPAGAASLDAADADAKAP